MTCPASLRAAVGERLQTGVNETRTETRPLCGLASGQAANRRQVSLKAISWALNLAPVPTDSGGQPSSACKFVLVGR